MYKIYQKAFRVCWTRFTWSPMWYDLRTTEPSLLIITTVLATKVKSLHNVHLLSLFLAWAACKRNTNVQNNQWEFFHLLVTSLYLLITPLQFQPLITTILLSVSMISAFLDSTYVWYYIAFDFLSMTYLT